MTDISIWVSILGLLWPLISIMSSDFRYAPHPPTKGYPPPAVTSKFKGNDRYIVMGVDFSFQFHQILRPPHLPPARGHPPPAITLKFKDDRYTVTGVDFGVNWAADFNNAIRFQVRRPARRPRVTLRPLSHQNSYEMTDIWLWVLSQGLFVPLISIMPIDIWYAAPPADKGLPAARHHIKI